MNQWYDKYSLAAPCFQVKEYEMSIIQMLINQENMPHKMINFRGNQVSFNYNLSHQHFVVSSRHRALLINWLVKVHNNFIGLRQETLHICVTLIDRILARNTTAEANLPLLGLTCFMIATKFEDIEQPSIDNLCQLAARMHIYISANDIKYW